MGKGDGRRVGSLGADAKDGVSIGPAAVSFACCLGKGSGHADSSLIRVDKLHGAEVICRLQATPVRS